ncbi:MAG: UDP-N-acetylmuramoyl-L-alanine--D-glutamate ligase [Opitutae bacterium]|nr:UDP-N-acetylmuramoyl-L-alanine--D-glutamate ligase [Opitutae bacterium]
MKTFHTSRGAAISTFKRVAIFGAGVSGQAVRRLVLSLGLELCLFDQNGRGDAADFSRASLSEFDAFVFSPGFAIGHPWRVLVQRSGRPCFSELGFAALHWRGRVLGVTGTNGKTTITSLLCNALNAAGQVALEAGNIGTPFSDCVLGDANHAEATAVCEISSFQAELPDGLQLDGLIWSNFAEDHLDRYDSMAEYFASKAQLLSCLRPDAPSVLGADVLAFNPELSGISGLIVVGQDSSLIDRLEPDSPFRNSPQSTNFALTAALWRALDCPVESLIDSANAFQLAAHRLSLIDSWGGVTFWNDSKATNFHAVLAAIDGLDGLVYWIGGGSGKGGDFDAFARSIAPKVEEVFLYGDVAESLAVSLKPFHSSIQIRADLHAAVVAATGAALANSPSVVLLSPGFASFDQFSGYAARGKSFISTVFSLKDAHRLK